MMLVNEYSPLRVGGAELQAERLSCFLAGREWRVSVITRGFPGLPPSEQKDGVDILRVPAVGPSKFKTISFVLGTLWKLWRLRDTYDVLHAHLAFGPAFAAVIAARLLRKSSMVKLGNSGAFGDIETSKRTIRGRFRLAMVRKWADVVIALDDQMEAEAVSAGFDAKQIRRMVNGIDASSFLASGELRDTRESFGLSGKTVVLYIGRLSAQKSLPTLIRAIERASHSCSTLHLMLVGDGPERGNLEALVSELNVSNRVTFAGLQSDVRAYLSAADIFALPSLSEGISNALLEAMASGLACVASSVGGTTEVLDHGNCGVLLAGNDLDRWTEALLDLAMNEKKRQQLGCAARTRIAEVYDFEVVGRKYISLYEHLIAQQGGAHA